MGIAKHSIVSFRIFGDDLVPSDITSLLGCEPTKAFAKGDIRVGSATGNRYMEKTGRWSLAAHDRRPEDVPGQILEILGRLPRDSAVWARLGSRFTMDFFCGVFMGSSNDGLEFPPELLGELSSRGISLSLDIYDRCDE